MRGLIDAALDNGVFAVLLIALCLLVLFLVMLAAVRIGVRGALKPDLLAPPVVRDPPSKNEFGH